MSYVINLWFSLIFRFAESIARFVDWQHCNDR